MYLFNSLKRSLLGSVQVSCANDRPSSQGNDAPTGSPEQKCKPIKAKPAVDANLCKGNRGKSEAEVAGAGGGSHDSGGGDDKNSDRVGNAPDRTVESGNEGKTSGRGISKSPIKRGDERDVRGRSSSGGRDTAENNAKDNAVSVGKAETKSGSDPTRSAPSGRIGPGTAARVGAGAAGLSKYDGDDGGSSGMGGMGGKGDSMSKGIVDDSATCLSVDGLPAGYMHPGLLRHLHNGARNRLPSCFEGAFVCVKQSPIQNWIFGHTISFSSVSPGGYKLLTSYVDEDSPGQLPYFVMESAPGGQISCEARVPVTRGTKATVFAQIANAELYSFETIIDTCFNSFTTSLIAVNREFVAMHYLQAVTNELCLGAEVVIRGQGAESSSLAAAARYMNETNFLSGTFGSRGLDVCFARAINPVLTVAAMLEVGFALRNAVATLGYEWHADDWTVRSSMDSDGLVGCTLHRTFPGTHGNFGCAFSALLNHPNDKFRMGFGITATLK